MPEKTAEVVEPEEAPAPDVSETVERISSAAVEKDVERWVPPPPVIVHREFMTPKRIMAGSILGVILSLVVLGGVLYYGMSSHREKDSPCECKDSSSPRP